ncbi:MAG: AAA family ATPase, partial [Mycoplasmataceae bacterium]|nr:AAA family ATPase [Mycoplasmataceae bacterium]
MVDLSNDENYLRLVDNINNGINTLVLGCAGTGKTTLINYLLRENLSENKKSLKKKRIVITTSTGVATSNYDNKYRARTIHSYSGIGPCEDMDDCRIRECKSNCDVLAIDEIGMISSKIFDLIVENIETSRKKFGVLLLIGDPAQLEPVKSTHFFWESKTFKERNFDVICLNKVHRQKEKDFTDLLALIRNGKIDDETLEEFNKQHYLKKLDVEPTKLVSRNDEARKINYEKLAENKHELYTFKDRHVCKGKYIDTYEKWRRDQIVEEELNIKVGCNVMILKNNFEENYVNGTQGEVKKINKDTVEVKLPNGHIVEIGYEEYTKFDASGKETMWFRAIPLKLAYAITIHKSQGMT